MPTIRIDEDVYAWLQMQAKPFEDTPNSVLRRIAGLEIDESVRPQKDEIRSVSVSADIGKVKTPQGAYREPILKILKRHGGEAQRATGLRELEKIMESKLTEHDKSDIKSGSVRWQKSAEWEVRVMREQGLLKPVTHTPSGTWALTEKGHKMASAL
jgi:hypothetical protein